MSFGKNHLHSCGFDLKKDHCFYEEGRITEPLRIPVLIGNQMTLNFLGINLLKKLLKKNCMPLRRIYV